MHGARLCDEANFSRMRAFATGISRSIGDARADGDIDVVVVVGSDESGDAEDGKLVDSGSDSEEECAGEFMLVAGDAAGDGGSNSAGGREAKIASSSSGKMQARREKRA